MTGTGLCRGRAAAVPEPTDEVAGMDYRPRLDLYDRRWEVYTAVERFVSQVLERLAPELEHIAELHRSTVHARFLFGSDINDYLGDLISHAVELRTWNHLYEQHRTDRPVERFDEIVKGRSNETRWFSKQQGALTDKFMRYMDLSNVGVGAEVGGPDSPAEADEHRDTSQPHRRLLG